MAKHAPGLPTSQPARTVPLDDIISNIGDGWFQTRLTWVCGLGFSAAAIEVVLTAFVFTELREAWNLSDYQLGVVPTVVGIGSVLGELGWGPIADKFGRARVFVVTAVIVTVFGAASACVSNIYWFAAMRFLVGLGYGGNIAVDFALFAEFLPRETRGRSLFLMAGFWPIGQLTTCVMAGLIIPRWGWRYFVATCAIPSLLTAFLRPLIPESPRWLLVQGREEEATEVCRHLAKMNGRNLDDVGLSAGVRVGLGQEEALNPQSGKVASALSEFCRLFSKELAATTIGVILYTVSLGAVGYGALTLMPTLLEAKGIPEGTRYLTMIVNTFAMFPGILLAGALALWFGRLLPLRIALIGTAGAMFAFAAAKNTGLAMLATSFCSMCIEVGWALLHTYVPEVYPTELRATAIGATSALSAVISFPVPLLSAHLLSKPKEHGDGDVAAIMMFGAASLIGAIAAIVCFHIETKDRELQDRVHKAKV